MDSLYAPLSPQPVEREAILPWIEVAQSARLNSGVLAHLMPPKEGSLLRPTTDDPFRNMAWFCHGLLEAAADHMISWADYAVPLKFNPETVLVHTLRPVFTLARAAIEAAAQAIWMLSPEEPADRARRYITLATWDLNEQVKAAVDAAAIAELKGRRDPIFAALGLTARTFRPPKYLDMIREATEFLNLDEPSAMRNADLVERVWRCAAAAAHGKNWPDFELHDRAEVEGGLFSSVPKIEAISEVLKVADSLLSAGVILFATHADRMDEYRVLWEEASQRLRSEMTLADYAEVAPRPTGAQDAAIPAASAEMPS